MRHLLLVGLLGCGGGTSGEPMMGTVSLSYGSSKPKMVVGAAVQSMDSPDKMLVQMGSDNVDCKTYLDVFLDFDAPSGSFIFFHANKVPGTANTFVSVEKSGGNDVRVNEAQGVIVIDAVEPRVIGTVTVTTTDQEIGMISASGTFDVKRCF